jgi:hypothetical protein
LFQTSGTSTIKNGTISGNLTSIHPTVIEGVAALTASLADSGRTFILGGGGGDTTMALPEMSADNIGFNCELIVTGALANTAVIQTVDSNGASATSDRFLASLAAGNASGEVAKVTVGSDNKLDFLTGCADADDACVVEVRYIAANKALVKGVSLD